MLRVVSLVMSWLVSWLLFTWMIARLPRESISVRSSVRAGLLAAVGFAVILGGIWGNSVSIDPLGFKYHTGYGPQAFTSDMTGPPASSGGSSGSTGSSGTAPEPGTLALAPLGLGLLAAGFAWRRRREHRPSSA